MPDGGEPERPKDRLSRRARLTGAEHVVDEYVDVSELLDHSGHESSHLGVTSVVDVPSNT
jgi:hypothetical protein